MITMTTTQPTCPDDVDWLAFCYAAGELSPQEAARFESRLATEQPLREALARAVELTQVVASTQSVGWAVPARGSAAVGEPLALPPSEIAPFTGAAPFKGAAQSAAGISRFSHAWLGIGIAAAILLVLNVSGILELTLHAPVQKSPRRAQLASAWSEARAQLFSGSDSAFWPALEMPAETEDEPLTHLSSLESSEAPSWLTAALLGQMASAAAGPDSLNDGPLEN